MKASHFHLLMMVVWGILLVPSLTVWRDSLVYVVLMSWYSIFIGHWSSLQASRAEEKTCKLEEKLEPKRVTV